GPRLRRRPAEGSSLALLQCPARLEILAWELDAHRLQVVEKTRTDAGRLEVADDATVLVRSRAHEAIDLLHLDHVALQARHLGDAGDLALAVGKAGELHDDVDRAGNLAADRGDRHRHTGHAQHLLKAADGVAWRVGVDGGHRTFMAGVHRLQHVERFLTSALAENHTVRAHAQRVLDQVALPDLAMPFHVGGTRLHPSDV